MRSKNLYGLLLALLLPLLPLTGYCWGPIGHRVVAEIAWQHLSPEARKAITGLLGRQPLAMIANWPDFIKSDTTHKYDHTNRWHYVDFPGNISKDKFNDLLKAEKGENLFTQTQAMITQLKSATASKEEKVFALSFLVHLIGDMHQPLHVGRDEDQGGNKITVYWFNQPSNLHRIWDEQLIEFQQLSYTEYVRAIDIAPAATVRDLQRGSIQDWMYESHVLSDKVYAKTKEGDKLSYRYNYVFLDDLNQQLLKGGLRLAAVLNGAFK
ncbi:S1/P1 nuclease [Chitinophaga agrisoli]|uniref:S1/P1 nuclease n=1 Tax=Chitinophaga agrisoli TaxID=2607653 RepID=A0A5B2VY51_9BACT|nr:S1/P1 nuclease [Chitinophaga agrisoli]KAA2244783.1 S1/P1 nuclease [Chitinophaga agrisoli]